MQVSNYLGSGEYKRASNHGLGLPSPITMSSSENPADEVSDAHFVRGMQFDSSFPGSNTTTTPIPNMAREHPKERQWHASFAEVGGVSRLGMKALTIPNDFLGRKLKCDGIRPSCANCHRRGYPCSYTPVSSSA
jgi:hypothetical protein